jgi:hypothetical protein
VAGSNGRRGISWPRPEGLGKFAIKTRSAVGATKALEGLSTQTLVGKFIPARNGRPSQLPANASLFRLYRINNNVAATTTASPIVTYNTTSPCAKTAAKIFRP